MRTLGLLFLSTLFLAACASQAPTPPADTVRIGVLTPLSGPNAVYGEGFLTGIETAVAEANAAGGSYEIVTEDNKGDPKEALTAVQSLLLKKPDIIISSFSGPTVAITPVVAEQHIPLFGSMTLATFNKDYENSLRYFFLATDSPTAATTLFRAKEVKTVGIYYLNNEAGVAAAAGAQTILEKEGFTIVAKESFQATDTDHRTSIEKVVAANPDAVYVIFALRPDQVVAELKTRYAGLLLFSETATLNNFEKSGAFDGTYQTTFPYALHGTAEHARFVEKFGEGASGYSAFGYDLTHAITTALTADPDMTTLVNRVAARGSIDGIAGHTIIDPTFRQTSVPMSIGYVNGTVLEAVQ